MGSGGAGTGGRSGAADTGANSGAGAETGADSGAGADTGVDSGAGAYSLFLRILLFWAEEREMAGGLDSGEAGGLV